jgi:hypothetical protein
MYKNGFAFYSKTHQFYFGKLWRSYESISKSEANAICALYYLCIPLTSVNDNTEYVKYTADLFVEYYARNFVI